MERVWQRQAEVFAEARTYFPERWQQWLGFDLFCGDALFAGICATAGRVEKTVDGRSYRTVAHVLYPYHAVDKRVTIVAPYECTVAVAIHEIAHVLHWHVTEPADSWDAVPRLEVTSSYAATNRYEEFAEAATMYLGYSPRAVDDDGYWTGWSQPNAEWFARLGRE